LISPPCGGSIAAWLGFFVSHRYFHSSRFPGVLTDRSSSNRWEGMLTEYVLLKFFHILIAILALGTSAGLGVLLEFFGDHPVHGPYLLRAIKRMVTVFVIPGYVLTLATGLGMVNLAWPLATRWIQAALALWGIGLGLLAAFQIVLRRQLVLLETAGPLSASYRRTSLLGRGLGAGAGLVVVAILYLMVFKPGA
jgi:uncharacterized membrane protein